MRIFSLNLVIQSYEYVLYINNYDMKEYCVLDCIRCLKIHGYIGCLNIHGTHVTANTSTNNNVSFFVSDLKIVYYNNY